MPRSSWPGTNVRTSTPAGSTRARHRREQGPAHLPQHPRSRVNPIDSASAFADGVPAVRPQPQPTVGARLGDERLHQLRGRRPCRRYDGCTASSADGARPPRRSRRGARSRPGRRRATRAGCGPARRRRSAGAASRARTAAARRRRPCVVDERCTARISSVGQPRRVTSTSAATTSGPNTLLSATFVAYPGPSLTTFVALNRVPGFAATSSGSGVTGCATNL